MATPVSTELTDLVYDVLNNTLDAVINARMDQERRYLEIVEDTFLSAEEFIEKHGLRQEIEVTVAGNPVPLQTDELDALLLELYQERQAILRRFVDQGPPRLRVEQGNINLKLAFSVEQQKASASTTPASDGSNLSRMGERPDLTATFKTAETRGVNPDMLEAKSIVSRASLPNLQMKLDQRAMARQVYRSPTRRLQATLPDPENTDKIAVNALSEISLQFTLE